MYMFAGGGNATERIHLYAPTFCIFAGLMFFQTGKILSFVVGCALLGLAGWLVAVSKLVFADPNKNYLIVITFHRRYLLFEDNVVSISRGFAGFGWIQRVNGRRLIFIQGPENSYLQKTHEK